MQKTNTPNVPKKPPESLKPGSIWFAKRASQTPHSLNHAQYMARPDHNHVRLFSQRTAGTMR